MLDIHTLSIVAVISALAFFIATFTVSRLLPQEHSLRDWVAAAWSARDHSRFYFNRHRQFLDGTWHWLAVCRDAQSSWRWLRSPLALDWSWCDVHGMHCLHLHHAKSAGTHHRIFRDHRPFLCRLRMAVLAPRRNATQGFGSVYLAAIHKRRAYASRKGDRCAQRQCITRLPDDTELAHRLAILLHDPVQCLDGHHANAHHQCPPAAQTAR